MLMLPLKTRINGFDYHQVVRTQKYAIYAQHIENDVYMYEIFQIRRLQAATFHEKEINEREAFPTNEDFGYTAWTYNNIRAAIEKLTGLIKKCAKGEMG